MIVIGQGGGPLGGPVNALQGAVNALETNDRLRRQDRAETRQDRLDIQREADAAQLRKMREQAMQIDEAQNTRAATEHDWQMKRRQDEQDQEIAARQSSAAILRGLTGEDVYDPNVGPVRPGYTVDAKSPFPPSTQRAISELQQRASSMDPQEVRAELDSILKAGRIGIETQGRARLKSLLKNLSTPSVNADGQEIPGVFDENRAAEYEKMIDGDPEQGVPPADARDLDQIEAGVLGVVREGSKAQAVRNMTGQAVTRLRSFQANLEAMRQQAGGMADGMIDPEAEAEFDAQVTALEQLGPTLTPSAIAAAEKYAMSTLRRGSSRATKSTKDSEKPRSEWDAHDWYDRDVQNAKALGYEGKAAEDYIARSAASRNTKNEAPTDMELGRKAADPSYKSPGEKPTEAAKPVNPWSKEGTPDERVQAAAMQIAEARRNGDMATEAEVKAALDAAYAGEPMPQRATDRRGKPIPRGEFIGRIKGGKRKDTTDEADRLNRMLENQ